MGKTKIAFELLVVTVVAYFVASAGYLFVKPAFIPSSPVQAATVKSGAVSVQPLTSFEVINSRNLFKAFDPKAVKKEVAKPAARITQLPVSKLGIKLMGTIYSNDPSLSRAIVLEKGKQNIVKINQKVGGLPVTEINRRAIILRRGAKDEALLIEDNDAEIAAKSDVGRVSLSKEKMREVMRNPDSILDSVDIAPGKKGDKVGLLVTSVESESLLHTLGLRSDDLVLSVNGKKMDNMKNMAALQQLGRSDSVTVEIWRNGSVETLAMQLR